MTHADHPLGSAFVGETARASRRLLALSIDLVLLMAIAAITWGISTSALLAAVVAVEVILGMWVVQARTGASIGKMLLGLRVSRADAPYSPGLGRAFIRSALVGIGSLFGGIGAWVVEGSAGWDASGRGRSWADHAADTIVVARPRRADARGIPEADEAPAHARRLAALMRPRTRIAVKPDDVPRFARGASATPSRFAEALVAVPVATAPEYTSALPEGLLLIFDTGQREQLPAPVSANLGRNPQADEPTDLLVVINDPDHTVSKTHARLEHTAHGTWITDTGSTNGTELVDDQGRSILLPAGVPTQVRSGTQIRVGDRVFTVSRLIGAMR